MTAVDLPGFSEGDRDWAAPLPLDVCTLPTVDRPLRVAEFDALFAETLRIVDADPDAPRVRLVLEGDAALPERVGRLCDKESSCCSFFTFVITPLPAGAAEATRVALDIEVPAARADVLAALVARAEGVRRG